ncbi:histidinol-phosphate transaminase [Falsiroseomonas sp.]|uniref:histidinol-phosphate transaminase n=1 Tax=Falsiroseomonas sp. TaxID=2870721 RepID=UPI00356B4DD5
MNAAWARGWIRALPSYVAPPEPNAPGLAPLHLNESPHPPSPRAIAAAQAACAGVNRYPDVPGRRLAAALAERTGVPAARIVFGAGSDELIHLLCQAALEPGLSCVMPAPSFPRYLSGTRIQGAEAIAVPLWGDGANDVGALAAAIRHETRLVFACTPNPPSGGALTVVDLARLAAAVPPDVLLAVDEAYVEFAPPGADALAALAARAGNWVVLRTFSKAHGLAGLRIGYALCGDDATAEMLKRIRLQFAVTAPAFAAAEASLADTAHLARNVAAVTAERARLAEALAALGLQVWPSAANFVSATLPGPAAPVIAALRAQGILVRDWRDARFPNEIRITIGLPAETDALLAALRALLHG